MPVKPIESYDEFNKIINSGKVVVIDFWATWCGPCKVISPIFEQLSNLPESADVEFYKVDVDTQTDIAAEVGIRAMPTFVAFRNGEKIQGQELIGANPTALQTLVNASVELCKA
ncbi:thioredoxin [Moniliophthora roreri MCA 2997]|uniref:Thioredoxin n=2 Tax=Moniliophthora roreri TaxID=221103 RepID=V2WQC8_MONRO|nr:thioredoxin [Moniliophthora roreri MCA 2997]KAI3618065.1 thioredoxin [Moniliophthora roreri]